MVTEVTALLMDKARPRMSCATYLAADQHGPSLLATFTYQPL